MSENATPFRSLVVVPRTHEDGTFANITRDRDPSGRCGAKGSAARAIQLDIRPNARSQHQSALLLWNSKLVHQGATWAPHSSKGFRPPVKVPQMFDADEDWKTHLQREGYVVLKDVLEEKSVRKALKKLLEDVKEMNGKETIDNLDQVRERHLPAAKHKNDLRMTGGICHGKFAWHLRTCKEVSRVFEKIFDLPEGEAMTGSVDVVALAPPGSCCAEDNTNWLHVDYSPPFGAIWQGTLQIFPDSRINGSRWVRIGLMICKAPATWTSRPAAVSLLAACVVGAASKATAAVTEGELHEESKVKGKGPQLIPTLGHHAKLQDIELQSKKAQEVAKLFESTPKKLYKLVPEKRRAYVCPNFPIPERDEEKQLSRAWSLQFLILPWLPFGLAAGIQIWIVRRLQARGRSTPRRAPKRGPEEMKGPAVELRPCKVSR